jgi:hypothetical protein
MLLFPITDPNSLFSKMMITICEKFGTSGIGVGISSGVGVGEGMLVGKGGRGGSVGRVCTGADSVKAGWQAEANNETQIAIQKIKYLVFIMSRINALKPQYQNYNVIATIQPTSKVIDSIFHKNNLRIYI